MGFDKCKDKRGFGLFVIILLLGVVAMVAASVSLRTQALLQSSVKDAQETRGQDTAYSGLQSVLAAVERGEDNWAALSTKTSLPNHPNLAYDIRINSNYTNDKAIVDSDGTSIPPESIYVKSLADEGGELIAGASAIIAQERGVTFNYPAFGSDSVSLDNSLIDAFNVDGSVAPGDGSIRTNSTQSSTVSASNSSFVDGDVTVGPGGDPVKVLAMGGGSGFSGEAKLAGAELTLPDVPAVYDPTAPDTTFFNILGLGLGTATPGDYNKLAVKPVGGGISLPFLPPMSSFINILVLAPGDYYANELTSEGPIAILIPSGTVRIHVKDQVQFAAGSTSVNSPSAQTFQVYQTESNGQVDIIRTTGSLVLASESPVTVTQSGLKGAVYGSTVSLKDSTLSYPKVLDSLALNDKARGGWNLFGMRTLDPGEIEKSK